MVLETLVFSPLNQLIWLVAREYFVTFGGRLFMLSTLVRRIYPYFSVYLKHKVAQAQIRLLNYFIIQSTSDDASLESALGI
jgi:hypothetical protein